jgi:MAP3K TRAFs-binding domain
MSALCFVDMPFGKKPHLGSGVEVDFDRVYQAAIKPALEAVGLEAIRGDEERTGGIIHVPMFARLLLSEYVVADLTLANPNVFYELGIRHAARPYTTVPIFASLQPLPFDVAMVRAIPYALEQGVLTDQAAADLRAALQARLEEAIHGVEARDSPLFQLIPSFPGIDLTHEVTDVFQERVKHETRFREALASARARGSNPERTAALLDIQRSLGDLRLALRSVLVDLMLSYRDTEAWDEMIALCEGMPDYLKRHAMVRQQWALGLNRRNAPGDRDQALGMLDGLVEEQGADPETMGIKGRIHKDQYRELKETGSIMAEAALDYAIQAYTRGFEADPRDYYPGVNAVNLLVEKGDAQALAEAGRLVPLVSFAVARRGGATSSNYWDLATVLELAAIAGDWKAATGVLPRVLAAAKASWMARTTADNLRLLRGARERAGEAPPSSRRSPATWTCEPPPWLAPSRGADAGTTAGGQADARSTPTCPACSRGWRRRRGRWRRAPRRSPGSLP